MCYIMCFIRDILEILGFVFRKVRQLFLAFNRSLVKWQTLLAIEDELYSRIVKGRQAILDIEVI